MYVALDMQTANKIILIVLYAKLKLLSISLRKKCLAFLELRLFIKRLNWLFFQFFGEFRWVKKNQGIVFIALHSLNLLFIGSLYSPWWKSDAKLRFLESFSNWHIYQTPSSRTKIVCFRQKNLPHSQRGKSSPVHI